MMFRAVGWAVIMVLALTSEQRRSPTQNDGRALPIWTDARGIEFIEVPAGSFNMGSVHGISDEAPVHDVTLTDAFLLGVTEVTQAQWRAVMGNHPSTHLGADLPVEGVSWEAVKGFIDTLNAQAGAAVYRLPTEAEWEYACTCAGRWAPGSDLVKVAWYGDNSGGRTHAVKDRAPNPWGFFDLLGNVAEWCDDRYDARCYDATVPADPAGPSIGNARVIRGGSWVNLAWYCRPHVRQCAGPTYRASHVGFRLARSLP